MVLALTHFARSLMTLQRNFCQSYFSIYLFIYFKEKETLLPLFVKRILDPIQAH